MTWRRSLPLGILFGVLIAIGMFAGLNRSEAAEDGGTITGQVLWCTPLPYGVDFTDPGVAGGSGGVTVVSPTILPTEPLDPTGPDSLLPEGSESFPGQLYPLSYPYPTRLIPAGAVLVAVQGTTLSARTGEDGQFTIDGVPVGPFFTVAAGPVAGLNGAIALRPNVRVPVAGATVDVGSLSLGGPCPYYFDPLPLPADAPPATREPAP